MLDYDDEFIEKLMKAMMEPVTDDSPKWGCIYIPVSEDDHASA